MARDFKIRPTQQGNNIVTDDWLMGLGIYGDGSDGALTYDGSTTILGMAPSAGVYTLTRDIYATTMQVNSTATINAKGYRIFATTKLTNTGTIHHDGTAGIVGTGGAKAVANNIQGGNTDGNGQSGNGSTGQTAAAAGSPSLGGAGGGGGGYGAGADGGTGTITAPTGAQGGYKSIDTALSGLGWGAGVLITYTGGGGGGGGAHDTGAVTQCPEGGGGGGFLTICALEIDNTSGTIRAAGGNGAAATASTAPNAGGGGGGGGGFVLVASAIYTGNAPTAPGGNGGALKGTGHTGIAGNAGTAVILHP